MSPIPGYAEPAAEYVQRVPLFTAVLIHAGAAAAVLVLARLYSVEAMMGLWPWLAGLLAAVIGRIARLPSWWLLINLLLPPAACLLLDAAIPAPAYFAAFLALWLANAAAWRNRVPLYLSSRAAVAALLPLLPSQPRFRLLDAGCGTGSVLIPLSRARTDGCYYGMEMAPLPFLLCWFRARYARPRVDIQWGDFWGLDLSRFDIVYAYLSPAAMPRLWHKARREMRPGTLLVSNCFAVPGAAPLQSIPYAAGGELYVWEM